MGDAGRCTQRQLGRCAGASGLALLVFLGFALASPVGPAPPARAAAQAAPPAPDPAQAAGAALAGTVYDLATRRPLAGVRVQAGVSSTTTDRAGTYVLRVVPGTYQVRFRNRSHGGATAVDHRIHRGTSRLDIGLPPYDADPWTMRAAADRLRLFAFRPTPEPGAALRDNAARIPGAADVELSAESWLPTAGAAPPTVRVWMPDGRIVTMDTDEYLKGVVPAEMGYVFRRAFEALKAQAIASRTYAALRCLPESAGDPTRCEPGLDANVDTTTRTQAWRPLRYDVSDAAVDATSDQVVVDDRGLVETLFFARAVDATRDSAASPCCGGRRLAHLRAVGSPDPFAEPWGHGAGMSQEGAAVFASWGASADEILAHYYSGTRVTPPVAPPMSAEWGAEGAIEKAIGAGGDPGDDGATLPPAARSGRVDLDPRAWAVPAPAGDDDIVWPWDHDHAPSADPAGGTAAGDPAPQVREGPIVETDFAYMAVAARWSGRLPAGSHVGVALRTSRDGDQWSDWMPLTDEETDAKEAPFPTPPDMRGDAVADLATADDDGWTRLLIARGRFVQARVALEAPGDAAVEGLTLHYFNTDAGPSAPLAPAATLRADDVAGPRVIPRAGWGADERKRFNAGGAEIWPPAYTTPRAQLVHHTVSTNDPADPAAVMRSIYQYHAVTRGWGDIGYNFLIDHRGNIYEGRFGGERNGQIVQGGHALQYNANSIGVALLGTFTAAAARPSAAAESALVEIVAARGVRYAIDPTVPVTLAGTRFAHSVMGHRDALPGHTVCPGDGAYSRLPAIRSAVAVRMGELASRPTATRLPPPSATPARTAPPPATATRPPATAGPSATPSPMAGGCVDAVAGGDFEVETPAWRRNRAAYTQWDAYRGRSAMFVGLRAEDADQGQTYASAAQTLRLPARVGSARLTFALRAQGDEADRRVLRILDASGSLVGLGNVTFAATSAWTEHSIDLTDLAAARAGQEIQVYFGVINNGDGRRSYVRVDDVALAACPGAGQAALTPSTTTLPSTTTPPSTPSPVPSPTVAPSPTSASPTTMPSATSRPIPSPASPSATSRPTTPPTSPPPASPTSETTPVPPSAGLCAEGMANGGFEQGTGVGWRLSGDVPGAAVDTSVHGGVRALRLGIVDGAVDRFAYSAAAQRIALPAGVATATLTLWLRPIAWSEGDAVAVELRRLADGARVPLLGPAWPSPDTASWERHAFAIDPAWLHGGGEIEVFIAVLNRGASAVPGAVSAIAVDDIGLTVCQAPRRAFLPLAIRPTARPAGEAYP